MSLAELAVYKISCRDLEASLAFYRQLGFRPEFPPPPKPERAGQALGGRLYAVEGVWTREVIISNPDNPRTGRIALLEWSELAAPVAGPNAAGAGMMAFLSDDFPGDYERLRRAGVEFVTEPISVERPQGLTLVVVFRDPDGFRLQMSQTVKPTA